MNPRAASTTGALSAHYVYRLFDADGRLLYIGATYHVPARLKAHRYNTPWFSEVASVEYQTFPNRRAAFAAEAKAIHAEDPLYNRRHTPGYVEPSRRNARAAA